MLTLPLEIGSSIPLSLIRAENQSRESTPNKLSSTQSSIFRKFLPQESSPALICCITWWVIREKESLGMIENMDLKWRFDFMEFVGVG